MNVNGSGTAQSFSFSPGTGPFAVTDIDVLLEDAGADNFNKFGAITALTNGIKIQWTISGTTTVLAIVKDNAEMTNIFPHHQHFGSGAILSLLGVVTPEGFGNSSTVFKGCIHFDQPVLLQDSDILEAIVQDDLTAIGTLEIGIYVQSN